MPRLLLAALFACSLTLSAAGPLNIPFKEYKLDNGLRVILSEDHTAPSYSIAVTYDVGSRDEKSGRTGFAHLFEHMMYQGSANIGKGEHFSLVFTNGGTMNGTTSQDRTNYFETLPAKGDNLAWALELEADRMINASIAQADLSKEFSVVRNEFEIGENDPSEILSERMWSTAYLWHTTASRRSARAPTSRRCPRPRSSGSTRSITAPTTRC